MAEYSTSYISKGTSPEEIVELFGKLLHKLNYVMQNLDSLNVKKLSTNQTQISSEDGTTQIDGSLLKMYDADGHIRAVLGYNKQTGDFEFRLLKADGTNTITLNEQGNAAFSGDIVASSITGSTIDVDTNIKAGDAVFIGTNSTEDIPEGEKRIQFYNGTAQRGVNIVVTKNAVSNETELKIQAGHAIRIIADNISLVSANGVYDGNGNRFLTDAD